MILTARPRAQGISLSTLKAACRQLGITRWPYSRRQAPAQPAGSLGRSPASSPGSDSQLLPLQQATGQAATSPGQELAGEGWAHLEAWEGATSWTGRHYDHASMHVASNSLGRERIDAAGSDFMVVEDAEASEVSWPMEDEGCSLSHAGEELVSREGGLGEARQSMMLWTDGAGGEEEERRMETGIDEGWLAWYLQSTEDSESVVWEGRGGVGVQCSGKDQHWGQGVSSKKSRMEFIQSSVRVICFCKFAKYGDAVAEKSKCHQHFYLKAFCIDFFSSNFHEDDICG
eukprot:633459-Hanusia_phi.AAC.1